MKFLTSLIVAVLSAVTALAHDPFTGFANKGLVGVGRISATTFDRAGDGQQDTLGGFSAMVVDTNSLVHAAGMISGRLIGLPDRGFGDGAADYHPRLEMYEFTITPYYGESPVGQDQILLTNISTVRFTYGPKGTPFTGFDAGNTNAPAVPQSRAVSIGGGRRALDAEGIVLAPDGGYWVSDEYGPAVFRFDAQARFLETILPPAAMLPFQGSYPGTLNFTAAAPPTSGRRNNRGFEGLSLTPDGRRLVAFLQSPLMQDGGGGNLGRNTRIIQFDVDPGSATYGRVVAEHIYQLTLNGSVATNRHTPVSEVLALSATKFLVLERDGIGRGGIETNLSPNYKRIVLTTTEGASNLAGTAYDLEAGAPGQLSLPAIGTTLPAGLTAVGRQEFVDLLDPVQLAKFGLNTSTNQDVNSLSEKWEALALIPLKDPAATDDYLLLVGNDNDFKSKVVHHNGVPVGTNEVPVDIMLLAYRVTLPGLGVPRPANLAPSVGLTLPTGGTYAQGPLTLTAAVTDSDGVVVKAEVFEDGAKLGEKTIFPWTWELPTPTVGEHVYRVLVTDQDGATAEVTKPVAITSSNLAPVVTLTSPAEASVAAAPSALLLTVGVADIDGFVTSVDYYAGAVKLGTSTNGSFSLIATNTPVGKYVLTAVAKDNLGLTSTSAPVHVTVTRAVLAR